MLYVVSAYSHLRFSLCFPTLCFSWRVKGVLLARQSSYACTLIWRRTDFSEAFLLSEDHSHCAPFLVAVTHPRVESSTRTENRDFEKITLKHCYNGKSCTKIKFGSEMIQAQQDSAVFAGHLVHKYHKKVGWRYTLIYIAISASNTEAPLGIIAMMWNAQIVRNDLLYVYTKTQSPIKNTFQFYRYIHHKTKAKLYHFGLTNWARIFNKLMRYPRN